MKIRVKPSKCPNCKNEFDGAFALGQGTEPKPGDFSVCIGCGQFLRYGKDLRLESTTLAKAREFLEPHYLEALQRARAYIFTRLTS